VEQISSKPFFNSRVAKEMWAMKEATVVTLAIKAEVDWLRHEAIRCLKGETEWSTPISHLVDRRQPDHTAYSDACLEYGMGGYCHTLECWWQLSWEELHPDIRKQIDDYVRQRFHEKCQNRVWFTSTHSNFPPKLSLT
jgi:hypothetical protein